VTTYRISFQIIIRPYYKKAKKYICKSYKFSDEKFEQYLVADVVKTCDKRRTFDSFRFNKTILSKRNADTKGLGF
jgi:hypothetical protein